MSQDMLDGRNRPEPPVAADEAATLLGFLGFLRGTIRWKTAGLSDEELHTQPLPSTMTLGGLLKHLAYVEDYWVGEVLAGAAPVAPWDAIDWKQTPDWEWESALTDAGNDLVHLWERSVDSAQNHWNVLNTSADFGLDKALAIPGRDARVSARWVLTHLIEEYARHCGHADLLREAIDGSTGE